MRFSSEYDVNAASTCPAPGSTPSSEPMVVPRSTGPVMVRASSRVSHRPLTFLVTSLGVCRCSRLRMISATPNMPTASETKSRPPYSSRTPKVNRGTAGVEVLPDRAEQQPEHDHREGLQGRPAGQGDGGDQAEHDEGEVLGRPELQRRSREGWGEQGQYHGGDRAREERPQRRRRERRPCPSLTGHLVPVQCRDKRTTSHRGGSAGSRSSSRRTGRRSRCPTA